MTIDDFAERFQAGLDAMATMPMNQARRHYDELCASFAGPVPASIAVTDEVIDGVGVRRYRPHLGADGVVLYAHGGGFTIGSVESHQGVAAGLAQALGREVVSLNYRLIPEASYLALLDDVEVVRRRLAPVALVGDSAGARLVLDAARRADDDSPLGLVYPLLGTPSDTSLGPDAPLLSRQDVLAAWAMIAEQARRIGDDLPASRAIECLAVEHDPLTPPLLATLDEWRRCHHQIGVHMAEGMLHGALHARSSLPAMEAAWRAFCRALAAHLD